MKLLTVTWNCGQYIDDDNFVKLPDRPPITPTDEPFNSGSIPNKYQTFFEFINNIIRISDPDKIFISFQGIRSFIGCHSLHDL